MRTVKKYIQVKYATYEKLLKKKLEKQHKLGKVLTWDEFLLM